MRVTLAVSLLVRRVFAGGCENGTIAVHSLSFNGVKAVDQGRSRRARHTSEFKNSLGPETLFDRSRFDANLKRIQSFTQTVVTPTRESPGSTSKLNSKQDSVDVTITIAEGDTVTVAAAIDRGR